MKIILFEPQIPQNTGNIVRTCHATGSELILVRPLGFSPTDRMLKRAGLDYWKGVKVSFIDNLFEFLSDKQASFYFFSSHSEKPYSDVAYQPTDYLIFGSETSGLPPLFRETWPDKFLTIPMKEETRCLNLANAVSIVLFEAWRQNQFLYESESI